MNAPIFSLDDFELAFGGAGRGSSPLAVAIDALDAAANQINVVTECMHGAGMHEVDDTATVYRALADLWNRLNAAVRVLDRCRVAALAGPPETVEQAAVSSGPAPDSSAPDRIVLDVYDRRSLRAALERLERGVVDLAGVRSQDGEALHDIADAAKVFRYELKLDELGPTAERCAQPSTS